MVDSAADVEIKNILDEKETAKEEEKEMGIDADVLPVRDNEESNTMEGKEYPIPILPPSAFCDVEPKDDIAVKDDDKSTIINSQLKELAKSDVEFILEKYTNPPPGFDFLVLPQSMMAPIPFNHLQPAAIENEPNTESKGESKLFIIQRLSYATQISVETTRAIKFKSSMDKEVSRPPAKTTDGIPGEIEGREDDDKDESRENKEGSDTGSDGIPGEIEGREDEDEEGSDPGSTGPNSLMERYYAEYNEFLSAYLMLSTYSVCKTIIPINLSCIWFNINSA